MPRIVPQPDDVGSLPKMHPEKKAAAMVMLGRQKWLEVRDQIEHVRIGNRNFYSEKALGDFLRRHTLKPVAAPTERRPAIGKSVGRRSCYAR